MKVWASNVIAVTLQAWKQFLLWVDQGGNVLFCGINAIVVAAFTGERQNVGYADETLSAHAGRTFHRRRLWSRLWVPVIDALFFWQSEDEEVNKAAGKRVTSHCERAYWSERLRRGVPPEYREASDT